MGEVVWYIIEYYIDNTVSVLQKNAFKSRIAEFVDFKIPFPNNDLININPKLYEEDIERWAESIPTVLESQSLPPRRGGTPTVFGPKGCAKPKILVNVVDNYIEELENPTIRRLFINHQEIDIDEYLSKNKTTTLENLEESLLQETPSLERADAINIYKTPVRKYFIILY